MRMLFAALLLALLVGCGERQPKGWEYRPAHGAYAASLSYSFDDGEGTRFARSCNGEPQFMLTGGVWEGPEFTLTSGDKSWRFQTSQGEHGHYLVVEGREPNQAIAHATTEISFQVGKWRREIRPAEPLAKFVGDCT